MKKHLVRMALAGALAFGVASIAKADDAAAAPAAPTFSVVAQELATQSFGTYSGTGTKSTANATSGDQLGLSLQHVILGTSFNIDSLDTLTVKSDVNALGSAAGTNSLYLLEANDTHSLADINAGLAVKAGQIRIAFGADGYKSPDQLIRTNYAGIDALIPGGKVADGGANYDLGVELDQTYSDLTLQVAAVQNPSAYADLNGNGTKFDYVARGQWKSSNVALGLSDYYQAIATGGTATAGNYNNLNTLGANASVNVDVFALDLEAIFGNNNKNGYLGTLSAKLNGFTPAVWYEFQNSNVANLPSTFNNTQNPDLGAGVNFALGSKTTLKINVDFTGYSAGTTSPAGDLLALNSETVQLQEVF